MKKIVIAAFAIVMTSACQPPPQERLDGNLVLNPERETGYRELEIFDDVSQTTKLMPEGHYRLSMQGGSKPVFAVVNDQGASVASISLKDAKFRDDDSRFYMSVQNSKQPLDVYGGKKKTIFHRKREGKHDQYCTISCCTTHQDCTTSTDSNGNSSTSCTTVCDDCSGVRDEVWESNTFRYDYEIFFGKPGDFEVGSFIAKGQLYKEDVLINAESCH